MKENSTNDQLLYEILVAGLDDKQKAEFLHHLRDSKIKTSDTELASLLRTLLLFKESYKEIRDDIKNLVQEAKLISAQIGSNCNNTKSALTKFDKMYASGMEKIGKSLEATSKRVIGKVDDAYDNHSKIIRQLDDETQKIKWIRWRNILMFNVVICIIVGAAVWLYRDYVAENKFIIIQDKDIVTTKGTNTVIKIP